MTTTGRRCLVTGGAGFIGSNLVDKLLARGDSVVVYDNFSTGVRRFLESAQQNPAFSLVEGDIVTQPEALKDAMSGVDMVFHFSANADVRFGLEHPSKDLEQNTIGTFNVLEAMRANDVRTIAFTSTGSIYGEAEVFPTPEDAPFPVQTSLYGASKLAGEGMIQAYCEGYGMRGFIFRFVSVLGERYTHGHIYDFCRQLLNDPTQLKVLGDGTQQKSYVYVNDCLEGILRAIDTADGKVNVLNVGTDGVISVRESIGVIVRELGVEPKLEFSGGRQGWIGDNPYILLDASKLRGLGWQPQVTIEEGVARTVRWLLANRWVFEERA